MHPDYVSAKQAGKEIAMGPPLCKEQKKRGVLSSPYCFDCDCVLRNKSIMCTHKRTHPRWIKHTTMLCGSCLLNQSAPQQSPYAARPQRCSFRALFGVMQAHKHRPDAHMHAALLPPPPKLKRPPEKAPGGGAPAYITLHPFF